VVDPNRALFEAVVHLLAPLLDELVFVGGCTTGLFITDPAAAGRGGNDVVASHDLEDIIAVVDGRFEIVGDVAAADGEVRSYIADEIAVLLANRDFTEALAGFLLPDAASQGRRDLLVRRLQQLSAH